MASVRLLRLMPFLIITAFTASIKFFAAPPYLSKYWLQLYNANVTDVFCDRDVKMWQHVLESALAWSLRIALERERERKRKKQQLITL